MKDALRTMKKRIKYQVIYAVLGCFLILIMIIPKIYVAMSCLHYVRTGIRERSENMFLFFQILSTICLLVIIILFFKRFQKCPTSIVAYLCVIPIFASCISGILLQQIPMPTEHVAVTATGEKNEAALGNEVALAGIISDGKRYQIKNPSSETWLWYEPENHYVWMDESDPTPDRTLTREIVLDIPVGAGRYLIFFNNAYRGFVSITYKGETMTYDLYNEEQGEARISIPSSDRFYDDMVKLGRLV